MLRAPRCTTHTVSLADAFENYFISCSRTVKVITWNRIPAQFSPNRDLSVFPFDSSNAASSRESVRVQRTGPYNKFRQRTT